MTEGRPLITLDEALARTLALAQPLATERIPLEHALGRVLRDDARSALDIPAFDKATMDGFAVRVADVSGASHAEPAVLAIREDLPAGRLARSRLLPGTAFRIMTGAPLPPVPRRSSRRRTRAAQATTWRSSARSHQAPTAGTRVRT